MRESLFPFESHFHCFILAQPGHLHSFPEFTTALIGPTGRWQDRRTKQRCVPLRPRLFRTDAVDRSASMCLERADKGCIKGSVRDVRKAKSLVGRWLERPSTNETSGKTDHDFVEIVIERDTVVRGGGPSSPYSPFFKLNLRPRSPGSRCTLVIENWEKENFSKILSRRSSKLTPKNHFFSLGAVFETPNQLFISRLP